MIGFILMVNLAYFMMASLIFYIRRIVRECPDGLCDGIGTTQQDPVRRIDFDAAMRAEPSIQSCR